MIQRFRRIWLRQDTNLRDLIRNSGVLYAGGLVSLALTFAQQITTAGFLGAEDYGRLAVVVSAGMLVMLIIDFRTWEVGTKLLTRSETDGDTAETARVTTWLLAIELVTGIVGAIVIALTAPWMARTFLRSPELAGLITLYALAIPFRVLSLGVLSVFPRIGNRFDWLAQKSIAYAVVRLVLMTGAAGLGFGLPGVIAGAIIGEVFNFALLTLMAWQLYSPRRQRRALFDLSQPDQFDEGRRMLGQLWVSSSLAGLHYHTFLPIAALLTDTAQIGVLRTSIDIAETVERMVQPVSIVFTPRIFALYNAGDRRLFTRYLRQCAATLAAIIVPISLVVIVGGPLLLPTLLRSEGFADVPMVASILMIGTAIHSILQWWLRPAAVAARSVYRQNIAQVILLVLSVAAMALWIPLDAAQAAAWIKSCYLMSFSAASLWLLSRDLRANAWATSEADRESIGHSALL